MSTNDEVGQNKMFLFSRVLCFILLWSFSRFGISPAECTCRQNLFTSVTGCCFETEVLSTHHVKSLGDCGQQSLAQATCVGFKYRPSNDNEPNCKSFKKMENCLQCTATGSKNGAWKFYKAVKSKQASICSKNRSCKNDGKCVEDPCNKEDGFNCICPEHFAGKFCENMTGNFSSCQSLHQIGRDVPNGVYNIQNNRNTVATKTYCQMTSLEGCAGGGWTMVMKIDGNKSTFDYNSTYWSNTVSYNPIGGISSFDDVETKLPSYWSTSFTEICIGMKVGNDLRYLTIPYAGPSLYRLFSEGKFIATNVGREKWKSLIGNSSLQPGCNKEGFNIYAPGQDHTACRIGIVNDEKEECDKADSFLGLGGKHNIVGPDCYPGVQSFPVSGNLASCGADNGSVNIKSMGYILVR